MEREEEKMRRRRGRKRRRRGESANGEILEEREKGKRTEERG